MVKVFITGVAGFIGFSTAVRLMKDGYEVAGIDNMNGHLYDPLLKKNRLEVLKAEGGDKFDFCEGDITNFETLRTLFKRHKDSVAVCHYAAQAGVRHSMEYPEIHDQVNVIGTENVINAMFENGIRNVIFASSSSVYGDNTSFPWSEDQVLGKAQSKYSETKQKGEVIMENFAKNYKLNVLCIRPFTVYGPWGRPDMAAYKFALNILNDTEIPVYNSGNHSRDFTYIDDLTYGVCNMIKYYERTEEKGVKESGFRIFNLARGKSETLMKYIRLIEDSCGKKANMLMLEKQAGDCDKTSASVEKAKEAFGYDPKVDIDEGIPRFVKWLMEYEKKKHLIATEVKSKRSSW